MSGLLDSEQVRKSFKGHDGVAVGLDKDGTITMITHVSGRLASVSLPPVTARGIANDLLDLADRVEGGKA